MRVIWAFHEEDVGPSGPVYHGVNRGKKSIRLLNPVSGKSIPQDTASFDLRNVNVSKENSVIYFILKNNFILKGGTVA